MQDIGYRLLFIALTAFFAVISWFFVRTALGTTEKKEFLAACLCCLGSVSMALGLLIIGLSPVDQSGCSHEPVWVDMILTVGGSGLPIGHCLQAWRTRTFLSALAGWLLIYIGSMSSVRASLPYVVKEGVDWVGLLLMAASSQVWKDSIIASRGGFFSRPVAKKFGR